MMWALPFCLCGFLFTVACFAVRPSSMGVVGMLFALAGVLLASAWRPRP